jgi:VanZ family protein
LPSFSYADKIVHFFLYFFLVTIYLLAFPKYIQKKILLVIFAVLLGIFIEFLQHYLIPTRCGDIYDALANTLGSVIGLLFFLQFVNPKLK